MLWFRAVEDIAGEERLNICIQFCGVSFYFLLCSLTLNLTWMCPARRGREYERNRLWRHRRVQATARTDPGVDWTASEASSAFQRSWHSAPARRSHVSHLLSFVFCFKPFGMHDPPCQLWSACYCLAAKKSTLARARSALNPTSGPPIQQKNEPPFAPKMHLPTNRTFIV